jgi:autoinducer 2 (AI-2) kinase
MNAKYILALDAGTSSFRCVIFDWKGRPVSLYRQNYKYTYAPDCEPYGREFDTDELWNTVCSCTGKAIKNAGINVNDIAAISTTSQREGAVFLDSAGKELYAGPNIDLRAVTEGLILDNRFADKIFSITGHLPSLMFVPARLHWFRNNRPEVYRKINTVLSIGDWLSFGLAGKNK